MTIKLNLKIFLFAIIFYFTKQIQVYVLLMLFALIHEIGHLLCGLALGLKPKSLKVMPFGLCVEFNVLCKDYNKKCLRGNQLAVKKMLIALAGPFTNLIIIGIGILLQNKINGINVDTVIYANALIAIFNLLPIYPLDGGRCLKSILHVLRGKQVANREINILSNICVVLLSAVGSITILAYKNIAIFFIILYLWYLVLLEDKRYKTRSKLYKIIEKNKTITNRVEPIEELKSTI